MGLARPATLQNTTSTLVLAEDRKQGRHSRTPLNAHGSCLLEADELMSVQLRGKIQVRHREVWKEAVTLNFAHKP